MVGGDRAGGGRAVTGPAVPLTGTEVAVLIGFIGMPPEMPNQVLEWALPPDAGPRRVQGAVDALVARHEILRSRLVVDGGWLGRVVDPPSPVPLGTAESGPAARAIPIPLTDTWPVRWCLAGRRLVAVVHHLTAGIRGCGLISDEMAALLDGRGDTLGPALTLAGWAARRADTPRRRERAVEFARAFVREAHDVRPPVDDAGLARGGPLPAVAPQRAFRLHSTVLPARLRRLAADGGPPGWQVLLAAVGGAVARRHGGSPVPWRVLADLAGPQPDGSVALAYEPYVALMATPPDTEPLPVRAHALGGRWLRAIRHAALSDEDIRLAVHAEALDRGRFGLPWWFNFAPPVAEPPDAPGPVRVSVTRAVWERPVSAEVGLFVGESDGAMFVDLYPHLSGLSDDVARDVLWSAHDEIALACGATPERPAPRSVPSSVPSSVPWSVPSPPEPSVSGSRPDPDDARAALCDVVRAVTGAGAVPDRSFPEQAPLRAIPAVLAALDAAGWSGLIPPHLLTAVPLDELAGTLVRPAPADR